MSNFDKLFGGGRRFSAIKGRMSLTSLDGDNSPPGLLKARRARTNTATTDASIPEVESLTAAGSYRVKTMRSMTLPEVDEPETRPTGEELNKRFEEALDAMALPEANKEALRKQNDDKKWQILQAHMKKTKKQSLVDSKNDAKSAYYWIKKMQQRDNKGVPVFTQKDALTMQSVFRTSHKDFLADFIEGFAGVKALNRLTAYFSNLSRRRKGEGEILSTLIESYKLLMNNEIGMQGVLLVPESVQTIAMAMDFLGGNHALTEKVVTLLAVACWWNEQGRKSVMAAMRYLKTRYRELSTFQTIVYLFEHNNDVQFKASMATFITTVCNTPPSIEKRVSVRNHFFRLDVIKIFEKVLAKKPEKTKSALEEQGWKTIETQFEVFVTMMRQDQKEIVHKLIRAADKDDSHFDLSNLQDSWKILQKNALKADCQDELLNVVQALFLVPTVQTLAAPIYESIARFVFEATSIDKLLVGNEEDRKGVTDPPELNYEELSKLLKHKIEYDAKVETFNEKSGLVKRQQKLIRILQRRLLDISKGVVEADQAMNLEKELIKNRLIPPRKINRKARKSGSKGKKTEEKTNVETEGLASASGMAVDLALLAGLGITDTANEIEIMKEREGKLKAEIDALQKKVQILSKGGKLVPANGAKAKKADKSDPSANFKGKLDSTGLAPAGIAPGKQKVDPPPVPKKGMPGSLEHAPIEYTEEKPKLKLPFGKPPIGGKPGPGGAKGGGLEALFGARAAAMKPKKRNNKAEKERKALEKLGLPPKKPMKPTVKMINIFWNVIAPDKLENTIWPELSDQNIKFNYEELEKLFPKKQVAKKEKKKEENNDLIKLIDGRRRQNIAIALKKIKLDVGSIVKALTTVDTDIISAERLQVFIDSAPSSEEMTLLNKFAQEGSDASKLADEEKYLYGLRQIPNLEVRLQCIKTSYTFIASAKRIHSVIVKMKKALAEVNESKELRQILEIVLAIGNFMNGGTTRGAAWGYKLDILGNLINVKDAEKKGTLMHYLFVLFERNYPHLTNFSLENSAQVVNVSFKEVIKEMNALAKQIATVRTQVKKKKFSSDDKFSKRLGPFEVKATKDVENLQKMLEQVRKDFESLAVKFGETGNDVEPKTFFPKLVSFEQGLKRAGYQLSEMRENEARKRKAEDQKNQRNTVRKLKKLLQASTNEEGHINMDLIEMFKSQQNMKTNEVVDRFLAKYKRDTERKQQRERVLRKEKNFKKRSRKRTGN